MTHGSKITTSEPFVAEINAQAYYAPMRDPMKAAGDLQGPALPLTI
jgi:hypothetical protein